MTLNLTQQAGLDWSGRHEWHKGQSYVKRLTHLVARPQQNAIQIRCKAYGQETYQAQASIQEDKVLSAHCSCPVGDGGYCKHVAALLNKASSDPMAFTMRDSLDSALDTLEANDLRQIIISMLDKEPDLERFIYKKAAQNRGTSNMNIDHHFIKRLSAAFEAMTDCYDEQWEYEHDEDGPDIEEIEDMLLELKQHMTRMAEFSQKEAETAAEAHMTILEGAQAFYNDNECGVDYGLEDIQETGLNGLYDLLINADLEGDVREEALEAVKGEISCGYVDLKVDDFSNFYNALNEEEQLSIVNLLSQKATSGLDYARQKYKKALIDLLGDQMDDSTTEQLLRESHDFSGLALFLLKQDRFEEILPELKKAKTRLDFSALQKPFKQAGYLIILEQAAKDKEYAQEWLYSVYVQSNRPNEAHAIALVQSKHNPSLEWFSRLKKVSTNWHPERDELVRHLKKHLDRWQKHILIDFCLKERLLDQAFEFVSKDPSDPVILLRVAEQPDLPKDQAIVLTLQAAQQYVGERQRSGYAQAAASLAQLSKRIGLKETFDLVEKHFPERRKLPALRDELDQAGVLPK